MGLYRVWWIDKTLPLDPERPEARRTSAQIVVAKDPGDAMNKASVVAGRAAALDNTEVEKLED